MTEKKTQNISEQKGVLKTGISFIVSVLESAQKSFLRFQFSNIQKYSERIFADSRILH